MWLLGSYNQLTPTYADMANFLRPKSWYNYILKCRIVTPTKCLTSLTYISIENYVFGDINICKQWNKSLVILVSSKCCHILLITIQEYCLKNIYLLKINFHLHTSLFLI